MFSTYLNMLDLSILIAQLPYCLSKTNFSGLGSLYEGKVRDNYTKGSRRILIASDRLSAFDRIICLIPFKGQVLNQMAEFWFKHTSDIVPNHAETFPDPNVTIARECEPLEIEMVVRGYLTGVTTTSVWHHYERGERLFCGNKLPDGMRKNQQFDRPILTPSTKAQKGGHDVSVSPQEIIEMGRLTENQWQKLSDISLKLFQRGSEIAEKQGIILVDTKYEFGLDENGIITLIDEIHTPDSSRFWFADSYEELFALSKEQRKIDKEYLREWLAERGFKGEGEIPHVPDDVRVETARRYIEAYELITGQSFSAVVGSPVERIEESLKVFA